VISLVLGDKGSQGDWWHVMNIIVGPMHGRSEITTMQYAVVDRIVPRNCSGGGRTCGPSVSEAGSLVNNFRPELKSITPANDPAVIYAFDTATETFGQIVNIGINVVDCVTSADITKDSEFAIDWGTPGSVKVRASSAYVPNPNDSDILPRSDPEYLHVI
jgi:hypothetical protein